jgi:hypothetical protein
MKKITSFLFIVLFISCSEVIDNSEKIRDNTVDTTANENSEVLSSQIQNSDIPEGWMEVDIGQITFLFERIDMYGIGSSWVSEQKYKFKDTASFDLNPGWGIYDQIIKVKGSDLQITEMYVQNVVVIGVDSERIVEVPFCVLSNWKKSTSEWMKIHPKNNDFRFELGGNFDTQPLIVDLDELKTEIRNSCGEGWFEEFKDLDTLDKLPFSEFESQSNYKIITRDINSGKTYESIILFYTPTSC